MDTTVTGIGSVVVAELRAAGCKESTIGQYEKSIRALRCFAEGQSVPDLRLTGEVTEVLADCDRMSVHRFGPSRACPSSTWARPVMSGSPAKATRPASSR